MKRQKGLIYIGASLFFAWVYRCQQLTDLSWIYMTTESVVCKHPGGVWAAWLAGLLRLSLGVTAWVIPIILGLYGVWLCRHKGDRPPDHQLSRLLLVTLLLAAPLCNEIGDLYSGIDGIGGFLGLSLAGWLHYLFTPLQSIMLLLILIGISLLCMRRRGQHLLLIYELQKQCAGLVRHVKSFCYEWIFYPSRQCINWLAMRMRSMQGSRVAHEAVAHPLNKRPGPLVFQTEKRKRTQRADGASYKLPPVSLFGKQVKMSWEKPEVYASSVYILEEKLAQFGIGGRVKKVVVGPLIVLFEYEPETGVSISKIVARADDLALALQVISLRIIAPIPGKSVIGFECSKENRATVSFAQVADLLHGAHEMRLPLLISVATTGEPVLFDLAQMPHLLVAGSTGSGKSVVLQTIIMSLISTRTPDETRLILIDPKRLEFACYADIGHLLFPVVVDPREAVQVLRWAVQEMERRYTLLAEQNASTSSAIEQSGTVKPALSQDRLTTIMPDIVIVIDEWADLMMTGGKDAETALVRLAQMARAARIHLIVATQRPSVDVITGLIKVNIPARVACKVTSKIDSRTIIDAPGAELLLGKGDMLVMIAGSPLQRMHGLFIAHEDIARVACFVRRQAAPLYIERDQVLQEADDMVPEDSELYEKVVTLVRSMDTISISLLQRKLRIGYNRSARMIDYLEARGMILPSDGGKMRKVLR